MYGDQNTKYFHAMTIANRRRNYISSIKNDEGVWINSIKEVGDFFRNKFIQLFATHTPSPPIYFHHLFPTCITTRESELLVASPLVKEIKLMVKSLNPYKALGPNSLLSLFY